MSSAFGEPPRIALSAALRELRRNLTELDEAERRLRIKRVALLQEVDHLIEQAQMPELRDRPLPEMIARYSGQAPALGENEPRVRRVLIAEDSPSAAKVARRMVEKLGYQVDVVHDGEAALNAVAEGGYDVVLMDCKMPQMDGYQATRAIRQLPGAEQSVPVIALTASNLEGDDLRCFVAGMDDYLAKPVKATQLAEALERWMNPAAVSAATRRA